MTASAITARGLSRIYGEVDALQDVDLEVRTGASLAVLGSNGAGKSTLLRMLATLEHPTRGTLELLGLSASKQYAAIRRRIGYLGHDALMYRQLSPVENLTYLARLRRVKRERVDQLLDRVELDSRSRVSPLRNLSRGTVQRVAACGAVLGSPELLILDEPLVSIDPGSLAAVERLLADASTRIFSSHDPARAREAADYVLGLHRGRTAFLESVATVTDDQIAELYK